MIKERERERGRDMRKFSSSALWRNTSFTSVTSEGLFNSHGRRLFCAKLNKKNKIIKKVIP